MMSVPLFPTLDKVVLVVQDTSLNLLFAGHDTSASAIMLAVRHLKIHPEVLLKLRQEQQEVSRLSFVLHFSVLPLFSSSSLSLSLPHVPPPWPLPCPCCCSTFCYIPFQFFPSPFYCVAVSASCWLSEHASVSGCTCKQHANRLTMHIAVVVPTLLPPKLSIDSI